MWKNRRRSILHAPSLSSCAEVWMRKQASVTNLPKKKPLQTMNAEVFCSRRAASLLLLVLAWGRDLFCLVEGFAEIMLLFVLCSCTEILMLLWIFDFGVEPFPFPAVWLFYILSTWLLGPDPFLPIRKKANCTLKAVTQPNLHLIICNTVHYEFTFNFSTFFWRRRTA